MKTLSMIGSGRLGQTLGGLWRQHGLFEIGDILNRTPENGQKAVRRFGSGRVVTAYDQLQQADVFLIATSDDVITDCCDQLAACGIVKPGDVVFHCSGLASSDRLQSAARQGAVVASVHPVKSFVDPEQASSSFSGTYCAVEGDPAAIELLQPAFTSIGGRCFAIAPDQKALYHAGLVVVGNYLTTLIDTGARLFEHAGLQQDLAFGMMRPIIRGVLENIISFGTARSLTGPLARGDRETVRAHLDALAENAPAYEAVYRQLGLLTLELSRRQESNSPRPLDELYEILIGDTA